MKRIFEVTIITYSGGVEATETDRELSRRSVFVQSIKRLYEAEKSQWASSLTEFLREAEGCLPLRKELATLEKKPVQGDSAAHSAYWNHWGSGKVRGHFFEADGRMEAWYIWKELIITPRWIY